jgi:hypothetical protein
MRLVAAKKTIEALDKKKRGSIVPAQVLRNVQISYSTFLWFYLPAI